MKIRIAILAALLLTTHQVHAQGLTLKGTLFDTVAANYGLDPLLLYSIAITESATGAGKGFIRPYPYVFRTSEGPKYFKNRNDAEAALRDVLRHTRNVDIGMMQINLHYHPQNDPFELLDPHYNLAYAAQYLKRTLSSTEDPILGVGRYHSWTQELADWYGRRVWKTYDNLIQLIPFEQHITYQ
ncbi:MAG: lytic transglycosylase domain-containing protein [gamma proteobacterium symbiont of Clathrolucina costata]